MTIDQYLFTLMTASPSPFPQLGARIYLQTAQQRVVKPYCVITLLGKVPIYTQENNPSELRRWRFQLTVTSDNYLTSRTLAISIRNFFVAYSDRPGRGLLRALDVNEGLGWVEEDRNPQAWCDLDIMENLSVP